MTRWKLFKSVLILFHFISNYWCLVLRTFVTPETPWLFWLHFIFHHILRILDSNLLQSKILRVYDHRVNILTTIRRLEFLYSQEFAKYWFYYTVQFLINYSYLTCNTYSTSINNTRCQNIPNFKSNGNVVSLVSISFHSISSLHCNLHF